MLDLFSLSAHICGLAIADHVDLDRTCSTSRRHACDAVTALVHLGHHLVQHSVRAALVAVILDSSSERPSLQLNAAKVVISNGF